MLTDNLEMMEYLFAKTAADYALRTQDSERTRKHIRESLRLHRFQVLGWLMENGVQIPAALAADKTHMEVGMQKPDEEAVPL